MLKVTAGLGRADDYAALVHAGADELFCGYVPERWAEACGTALPLNRREVRWVNCQIGSESELRILRERISRHDVPVALTFNAPCIPPALYPLAGDVIARCLELGFDRFILADPGLLVWLKSQGLTGRMRIHLSGETGTVNSAMLPLARQWGAERIILPRWMALNEIAACTQSAPDLQYEAFILNELCHFHGAHCQSLHCDELAPMCHMPWKLSPPRQQPAPPEHDPEQLGAGGCGLCALKELAVSGVAWVKVVGRGALTGQMLRDVQAVHEAIRLTEAAAGPAEAAESVMRRFFPDGCSHQCYYP